MKRAIINIFFVIIISIMIFPLCVNAKSISTLETTATNGELTISGTTETGVLAVAALVYSESELVYMETCEANGSEYFCTLNNNFATGDYLVKVADYDGGDYVTDDISITNATQNNPRTADSIMNPIVIGAIALIGLFGITIDTKKRIN